MLRYTRIGLVARGAMQNADVASSLGYNPQQIYMWTFTAGAALSGPRRRRDGAAHRPPAVVGIALHRQVVHHRHHRRRRDHLGHARRARSIFGTVNQIVSFGSTPVIGEIAMLALAIILLRLMPQGITGRFFKNST